MATTTTGVHYVPRAIQIDSRELDEHFVDTIVGQLDQLQIDSLSQRAAELKLAFQVYLWYKRQYLSSGSVGLDLFKLKFYDSSQPGRGYLSSLQKYSFLLPIGLWYLKERLIRRLGLRSSLKIEKLAALLQLAGIVNAFALVFDGRYRTLHERLFSIRVATQEQEQSPRRDSASYPFLNRELLWQSLSEILTLLLPTLLASTRLKSALQTLQRQLTQRKGVPASQSRVHSSCCPLCGRPALNATSFAHCKHIYCYYCLATRLKTENFYSCSGCSNATIHSLEQMVDRIAV